MQTAALVSLCGMRHEWPLRLFTGATCHAEAMAFVRDRGCDPSDYEDVPCGGPVAGKLIGVGIFLFNDDGLPVSRQLVVDFARGSRSVIHQPQPKGTCAP